MSDPFSAEAETELSHITEMKKAQKGTEGFFFSFPFAHLPHVIPRILMLVHLRKGVGKYYLQQQNWTSAGGLLGVLDVAPWRRHCLLNGLLPGEA